MMVKAQDRSGMPLHWKMGIGFALGLVLGLLVHATAGDAAWVGQLTRWLTTPVATIFLNLIFMLIVPLMFSALVIGVAEMGDVSALGRIGWRTLGWTVVLTGTAVLTGLLMVNLFKPGAGVDPVLAQALLAENAERSAQIVASLDTQPSGLEMFLSIVPSNVLAAASNNGAILSLMFFALMFGVGMVLSPADRVAPLKKVIEGVFEVSMTLIGKVILLAPYAVACLMFNLVVVFGSEVIWRLGAYVLVVVAALAVHMFVTYSIALKLAGHSPLVFFRGTQAASLMAFSTASSNATLPTALRVADQIGLPPRVSRFVLTVGATANQNGTSLYEGVTVLFLAQFFGVDLGLGQQVLVMVVCILGGIGTAGVPAGALPVVALICGMVGINPLGIGLILGVHHLLDMCRTALNVTGDLVLASLVARGENPEAAPVAAGPQTPPGN